MSDSEATVEDTTLYETKDTPLAPNPQGSDEVVDRAGRSPSERKNDPGRDEANAEGTARKYSSHTDVAKKPSRYGPLGAIESLDSSLNRLSCKLTELGGKIDSLEKCSRYTMGRLGKLDDRVDRLIDDQQKMEATIEGLQNEIHNIQRGTDETSDNGDEQGGKAAGKITASRRKRNHLA
ncbi:hypothetical protein LTR66_004130 [Elasticomyces elasticus]|nr:hypothetical protein LTR66_004130 [Elasticomyces elasticus]